MIVETLEEQCGLNDSQREAWELLLQFIYENVFENLEENESVQEGEPN